MAKNGHVGNNGIGGGSAKGIKDINIERAYCISAWRLGSLYQVARGPIKSYCQSNAAVSAGTRSSSTVDLRQRKQCCPASQCF